RLVCGIHGASSSERTLLNAKYVFEQLVRKAVSGYSENGAFPESVTASLNGEELEIMLTAEDVGITRGTGSTSGYKGTVAFYAAAGSGGFGDSFGAANGSVSWFVFADKYHCARWDARVGWSLDSTDY
ncbi:MAG: hypothetical protein IK047_00555, partial [Clostridia bacterium]|nr:hypothetical protein [Clostridia bacterium]